MRRTGEKYGRKERQMGREIESARQGDKKESETEGKREKGKGRERERKKREREKAGVKE